MELLNKERAIKLFSEEAILVGTSDVIPEFRMREIFGDTAVSPLFFLYCLSTLLSFEAVSLHSPLRYAP